MIKWQMAEVKCETTSKTAVSHLTLYYCCGIFIQVPSCMVSFNST